MSARHKLVIARGFAALHTMKLILVPGCGVYVDGVG